MIKTKTLAHVLVPVVREHKSVPGIVVMELGEIMDVQILKNTCQGLVTINSAMEGQWSIVKISELAVLLAVAANRHAPELAKMAHGVMLAAQWIKRFDVNHVITSHVAGLSSRALIGVHAASHVVRELRHARRLVQMEIGAMHVVLHNFSLHINLVMNNPARYNQKIVTTLARAM